MTFEQLSLFDTPDERQEKQQADIIDRIGDWCLVYLVTKAGGNKGNLFILHQDDAVKFCSDNCSHGTARGGKWMFQWTSMRHFVTNDAAAKEWCDVRGDLPGFKFLYDTGKQDRDFERLGIHKPSIKEMGDFLRSIGYCFEYSGGARTEQVIDEIKSKGARA